MSKKHDQVKARSCPFCRTPASGSQKESWERRMKRANAGDPAAIREIGGKYFVKKDYPKHSNILQRQLNWEICVLIIN
jgi:hypothetical protein